MNLILKQFKENADLAEKKLDETFDCRQAEPYYVRILNLIKSHPELKQEFISEFSYRLENGIQPWELTQFCMRELKWSEIKEAAIKRKENTHDWRIISVMNDILEVYEEKWEDADLYLYYAKELDNEKSN